MSGAYNGWTNYETWVMALWIDNDQSSYEEARSIVSTAVEDPEFRVMETADALRDWQEELMPTSTITGVHDEPQIASVWLDLLSHAFGRVNWREIAENYLSELEPPAPPMFEVVGETLFVEEER